MWYSHGFACLLAMPAQSLCWLYVGTRNCGCLASVGQLNLATSNRNEVKALIIKSYREGRKFEIENWERKEDKGQSISDKRDRGVKKETAVGSRKPSSQRCNSTAAEQC